MCKSDNTEEDTEITYRKVVGNGKKKKELVILLKKINIKEKEEVIIPHKKKEIKVIVTVYPFKKKEIQCKDIVIKKKLVRYNSLIVFLTEAIKVHGDKFDYSKIKDSHIIDKMSEIKVICRKCLYECDTNITNHLANTKGCINCNKKTRWNYDRFILRGKEVHGDKHDYSKIKKKDIKGTNSTPTIICRKCNYEWNPTIHNYIDSETGCPCCAKLIPWTYSRFIEEIKGIDNHDFSKVKPGDICNANSILSIKCYICEYEWNPSINVYFNNSKCKCPDCSGHAPVTYERTLFKANKIHGNKYDYSKVRKEDVINAKSHLPLICRECDNEWNPTINGHINRKYGCPMCASSKGEKMCKQVLKDNDLSYIHEFKFEGSKKRYDFMFKHKKRHYILEFDGIQHFTENIHFHREKDDFIKKQEIDVIKTIKAIKEGYFVIRIDYKQIDHIEKHIKDAIKMSKDSNITCYFSDNKMYKYIIRNMEE
jgi:very-short-patch-repair endonuclease